MKLSLFYTVLLFLSVEAFAFPEHSPLKSCYNRYMESDDGEVRSAMRLIYLSHDDFDYEEIDEATLHIRSVTNLKPWNEIYEDSLNIAIAKSIQASVDSYCTGPVKTLQEIYDHLISEALPTFFNNHPDMAESLGWPLVNSQ